MLPNECLIFWNLAGGGGVPFVSHLFRSTKDAWRTTSNIVLLLNRFFPPKVDVPSCHAPSPHGWAHGWLRPPLATTSTTAGCGRPTARSGYTGQLLVLAEGTAGGNGPDAFARTSRGHGFSRRVEITATQERPVAQRLRSSKRRWEQWVWIPWGEGGT